MIATIRKWFTRQPKPPALTGRVHDYTEQHWGHAISSWRREGETRWNVMGLGPKMCMFCHIRCGDVLLTKMESGKVGRWRVDEVGYERDPADMFTATIELVGYEGAAVA